MQLAFQRIRVSAAKQREADKHRQPTVFFPALNELTPNPHREREDDEEEAQPERAIASEDFGRDPQQPDGGGEHREAHRVLEVDHPIARLGQIPEPRGLEAEQQVRQREAEANGEEEQENQQRWLREREAQRGRE